MMNVFVSEKVSAEPLKHIADNIHILNGQSADAGYQKYKLYVDTEWQNDFVYELFDAETGCFVQYGVLGYERFVNEAKDARSNLYLALTSRTVYDTEISESLAEYVRLKGYSEELCMDFMSVVQELSSNAVLHGSLDLNVNLLRSSEQSPEVLMAEFERIEKRLNDTKYGRRAIVMNITCHSNSVVFEIQDQGNGFDFDAFKEKYKDSALHKGMDITFLVSEEVEYDSELNLLRVIIKEKSGVSYHEPEVTASSIRIGVLCSDKRNEYNLIKKICIAAGFSSISEVELSSKTLINDIEQYDLFVFTAECDYKQALSTIKKVRKYKTNVELPILVQKSSQMKQSDMDALSKYANDFLGHDVMPFELISRVKTHFSMYLAQKKLLKAYEEYRRETLFARDSIASIESLSYGFIKDHKRKAGYLGCVQGTQSAHNITQQLGDFEIMRSLPYCQGFCFTFSGRHYFMFVSLGGGLSSILVVSYIKGCVEHIKDSGDDISLQSIMDSVLDFSQSIMPDLPDIKIICGFWDEEDGVIRYQNHGRFIVAEYDVRDKKTLIYKGDRQSNLNNENKIYSLNPDKIFYVFDQIVPLHLHELSTYSESLLQLRKNWSLGEAPKLPNLTNSAGLHIPLFLFAPLCAQLTSKM